MTWAMVGTIIGTMLSVAVVCVSLLMWGSAQMGKRIDDLRSDVQHGFSELRADVRSLGVVVGGTKGKGQG